MIYLGSDGAQSCAIYCRAEQHDEWTEGRRYLGLDVLARSRMTVVPEPSTTDNSSEVTTDNDLPALSA